MEYAMMRNMGAIDDTTTIITVVHDCQVLDIPDDLMQDHDFDVRSFIHHFCLEDLFWSHDSFRNFRMATW